MAGSVLEFVKSCYADPVKWQFVKSWTVFAFGVYLAKEFSGIDFVNPPPAM